MKIGAWMFVIMLVVPLLPATAADVAPPEDLDQVPRDLEPPREDLELARHIRDLLGLPPLDPVQLSGFCKPGAGCFPVWVDEDGDTMRGVLRMLDDIVMVQGGVGFPIPGAEPLSGNATLNGSSIRYDLAQLNMPVDFTNQLQLLQGAVLNATAGGTVFIDHDGNLSFADGSWFDTEGAHWFSNATFDSSVVIRGEGNHLFVTDGATLVTDNQSGLLTENGIGRVGTLDLHPLHLIVNNTTALLVVPGSTPNLVGGHEDNSAANGTIGVFIGGGGASGGRNEATADFTSILGGLNNTAQGAYAAVLGGRHNDATGTGSLAAGQRAGALHNGTFVWADGQSGPFESTGKDQFLVRAGGGVGINSETPHSALTVGGNITPAVNDTYSLGSPAHRWDQLYMASEIDYASDLLYSSGGALRAKLTTAGDFEIGGRFIGDGSGLSGVVATDLSDASVTTEKLQDGAVTSTKVATGAITDVHLTDASISTTKLRDGSVSTSKLVDGAVTGPKIADGAVTRAKIGAVCSEGQLLKHVNGSWTCGDDQGSASLSWSAITDKPAGFADDVDDDTTYSAGSGLISSGTTFSVDTSTTQARVGAACAEGSSIRAIAEDGTVTCEPDTDTDTDTTYGADDGIVLSGTMFSLLGCGPGELLKVNTNGTWSCSADADSGGDITGVEAGTGLTGGGTSGDLSLAVDTTAVQRRVTGECTDAETFGGVNGDGTVVCHSDDDTTYTSGLGLDLAGTTFAVNSTQVQSRVATTCAVGSSIRAIAQDGTVTCETDDDTDTTYSAGNGITLAGTEFSADDTHMQRRVASTCAEGSSIRAIAQDGTVTCELDTDTDTDTTYENGTGLDLTGTTFAVDTTTIQSRVTEDCTLFDSSAGGYVVAIGADGSVTCAGDDDTTYGAGDGLVLDATQFSLPSCASDEILRRSGGQTLSWTCSNDVDTTYSAGFGIDLVDQTFSADTAELQQRVTGTCQSGEAIRVIVDNGTVECQSTGAADTLDGLDATQFLRSDINETFDGALFSIPAGALGVNQVPTDTWTIDSEARVASAGVQSAAVRGEGAFGPTRGYLGVQGATDFDGIKTADWSGREIGVVGISDGASQSGNYGVVGHASQVGVRGENKDAPTLDYGELGLSGIGLRARGTVLAGEFLGDLALGRDSPSDDDLLYFDSGTAEWLKWDEDAARFEFSDDLSLDGRLYLASKLLEVAGEELRFDGRTVCTTAGECPGTTVQQATGVGALDPDNDKPLISGAAAVCWIDVDDDGAWEPGDWLILDVDDASCSGGTVEEGDMRLTATAYGSAFSRIRANDGEVVDYDGLLLPGSNATGTTGLMSGSVNGAFSFFDADGDGGWNAVKDDFYADVDRDGVVSIGDYRWTTGSSGLVAGSVVMNGGSDLGSPLQKVAGIADAFRWWELTVPAGPGIDDPLYLSMSGGAVVGYGDVRLSDLSDL